MSLLKNHYKKYSRPELIKVHNIYADFLDDIVDELENRDFELRCLKIGYGKGIDSIATITINQIHKDPLINFKLPY